MEKKYIVIGSGKLAVKIADYLTGKGLKTSVYENQISAVSSVGKSCLKKGIDYRCMTSEEMTSHLLNLLKNSELRVFSAINTYIFPREVLEHKNFKGINYHNALLPYHRGMNAEAWSIYDMDNITGITWHRIRPAIDEGEILIQKKIVLDKNVNSLKLLKMQSDLAYEAFLEIAPDLLAERKKLKVVHQETISAKMHKISDIPNNGYLSKKWGFSKTSAFLRAMDYGKLNTLKKPHIRFCSSEYEWDSYQIQKLPFEAREDSVEIESNNMVISKKGSIDSIVLINLQKREIST